MATNEQVQEAISLLIRAYRECIYGIAGNLATQFGEGDPSTVSDFLDDSFSEFHVGNGGGIAGPYDWVFAGRIALIARDGLTDAFDIATSNGGDAEDLIDEKVVPNVVYRLVRDDVRRRFLEIVGVEDE